MIKAEAIKNGDSVDVKTEVEGIGFFTMCIGGMMGNSENLILPIVLILIGAWLALSNKGDN